MASPCSSATCRPAATTALHTPCVPATAAPSRTPLRRTARVVGKAGAGGRGGGADAAADFQRDATGLSSLRLGRPTPAEMEQLAKEWARWVSSGVHISLEERFACSRVPAPLPAPRGNPPTCVRVRAHARCVAGALLQPRVQPRLCGRLGLGPRPAHGRPAGRLHADDQPAQGRSPPPEAPALSRVGSVCGAGCEPTAALVG